MFRNILSKPMKFNSLLNSSHFYASTVYPLLFKNFCNVEDVSSSFVIKQLEEKELDEATSCISSAFSSREMITNLFKVQNNQIHSKVRKDLEKALLGNLCLVCRDKRTDKLAGVVYYEDLTETVDFQVWEENTDGQENWIKLIKFYKFLYSIISLNAQPKERNDVLMMKKLAVSPEFTRLGVASNLIFAGRYIHPRTTKAKKSLMIVSNKKTYEFCLKHGWELMQTISVQDYKDASFAENGLIYLMKYEPKSVKTLIQELKSFFQD